MQQSQWQKLDPHQLPESAAIYAVLWRRTWLHLGSAANLKRALADNPWPYRIALSLSDAELLWMKATDPHRQEAKLKRMLRCQWQCLDEGQVNALPSSAETIMPEAFTPRCAWPAADLAPATPMIAKPLA